MYELREELMAAVGRLNIEWKVASLNILADETDIFGAIESFSIVELLLETEEVVERLAGRYVPLGDETIFDAQLSPLRKFSDWVNYVGKAISESKSIG